MQLVKMTGEKPFSFNPGQVVAVEDGSKGARLVFSNGESRETAIPYDDMVIAINYALEGGGFTKLF